jgi:hypothetical protein
MKPGPHEDVIAEAAREFDVRDAGTKVLAGKYVVRGRIAVIDTHGSKVAFDKTDLLLAGQAVAAVAIVIDSGQITIAAGFESGWDFVTLLGLGGGMPTRVTVPEGRLDEVVGLIQNAPAPVPRVGARPEE